MSTWTEAYTRCMDGEFFRGEHCPRDGHSNDLSAAVTRISATLRTAGAPISLEALAQAGLDGDLTDVLVIEFSNAAAAPDWLRTDA